MPSPVGTLTLVATDDGLAAILWENDRPGRVRLNIAAEESGHPVLADAERQLAEYFAGQRKQFALPLDWSGTAFQRQVWDALLTIPFGETRSYAQIAAQIGRPGAARAVGAANGRNPVSIVAPCHRVIGVDRRAHGVCRRPRRQGAPAGARVQAIQPLQSIPRSPIALPAARQFCHTANPCARNHAASVGSIQAAIRYGRRENPSTRSSLSLRP